VFTKFNDNKLYFVGLHTGQSFGARIFSFFFIKSVRSSVYIIFHGSRQVVKWYNIICCTHHYNLILPLVRGINYILYEFWYLQCVKSTSRISYSTGENDLSKFLKFNIMHNDILVRSEKRLLKVIKYTFKPNIFFVYFLLLSAVFETCMCVRAYCRICYGDKL